jgi:hypothetical protein
LGFPEELAMYLQYTRSLGFEETPDYDYLRGLFDKAMARECLKEDYIYDWLLLGDEKVSFFSTMIQNVGDDRMRVFLLVKGKQ